MQLTLLSVRQILYFFFFLEKINFNFVYTRTTKKKKTFPAITLCSKPLFTSEHLNSGKSGLSELSEHVQ